MATIYDLGISTVFIICCCALGYFGRWLYRCNCTSNCTYLMVMTEWLACMEFAAVSLEMGIVLEHFGYCVDFAYYLLLYVWWIYTEVHYLGRPHICLEKLIDGKCTVLDMCTLIGIQLLAGCFTCVLMNPFWSLGLAETHVGRQTSICDTNLHTNIAHGTFVELSTTFLISLMAKVIDETDYDYGVLILALAWVIACYTGVKFTGGFANSMVATVRTYNCTGHNVFSFFVVYWLGPFLGAALSVPTLNHVIVCKRKTYEEENDEEEEDDNEED